MGALAARLDSFIARHRRWILLGWVAVFVAALPFFVRQYDHLTDGGWEAPGSSSLAVQQAIESDFPRGDRDAVTAVLAADPSATPAARVVAVEHLQKALAGVSGISLPPAEATAAKRRLRDHDVVVVPLVATGSDSRQIDSAVDLRDSLRTGASIDGVRTYLTGRAPVWAGLHEISRENIADRPSGSACRW